MTVLANGTRGGPFIYISAYAFFQLPHGLFAVSIMTTFTPELSHAAARDDLAGLRGQLSRGLRLASVLLALAAGLYVGLARPLVTVLLQRGAFTAADASVLADTIVGMAFGLLPFSLYLFSLRAFYARHDTFTPFWVNAVENVLNIALAVPLYDRYGVPGLAVAFSGAYLGAAALSLAVLRARLGGIDGRRLTATLARVVAAGGVAAVTSWVVGRSSRLGRWQPALLALVTRTLADGGTYIATLVVLRADEPAALVALLPRRRRRPRPRRPGIDTR